jgi:adenylate cyclase class 2
MLEVEMKFPVPDFAGLEKQLRIWGAVPSATLREADHYFNAPDRDFARTDEALRLRRVGASNRVTYKGPKLDATTKTRVEIEVSLADGDGPALDFCRLLENLGYRPVAVVPKCRRIYRFERDGSKMEVCLDEVDGLGRFAEIEVMAEERQLESAQQVLRQCAEELGLTTSERRSYLELLLAKKR